jgi:hypothetical protein
VRVYVDSPPSSSAKAEDPRRVPGIGTSLQGASPERAGWPEPLADGNCVTARWGGEEALRQTLELTNRNRIQGRCGGVTRRRMGKPESHTDTTPGKSGSIRGKEACLTLGGLFAAPACDGSRGPGTVPDRREKSAEAIVAQTIGRRAEFDNEGAAWTFRWA